MLCTPPCCAHLGLFTRYILAILLENDTNNGNEVQFGSQKKNQRRAAVMVTHKHSILLPRQQTTNVVQYFITRNSEATVLQK